jgi:proteasome activator subunit 4
MHALSGVYPSDNRFVNEDVWNQSGRSRRHHYTYAADDYSEFGKSHNTQWGRLYEAKDVKVEWHGERNIITLNATADHVIPSPKH